MEFSVFYNNESEELLKLAPGETLMLSRFGQLFIINQIDNSVAAIPKQGKYAIVFESEDDLPVSTAVRVIY